MQVESLLDDLEILELSKEEKKHLLEIAHAHLHQTIIDAILSELADKEKKIFLANLHYESDEKIWEHLNKRVEKIEDKIKKAAEETKVELRKDIGDVRKSEK